MRITSLLDCVAGDPDVPTVSPSRSTVTRSQMRKISSILCDTYTMDTPRCLSSAISRNSRLRGIVEQRTGGLVHQDDARVHAERARDGHQLHLADRQATAIGVLAGRSSPTCSRNGRQNASMRRKLTNQRSREMQVADDHVLADA